MGGRCSEGEYWDVLLRSCLPCHLVCKQRDTPARCAEYCVAEQCKAFTGHYYDRLLRKCLSCAEVCGSHPAHCAQHCQTRPPAMASPTQNPAIEETTYTTASRGRSTPPTVLQGPTILLYSLLALSMVLLVSALSVALLVLIRTARTRAHRPGPTVMVCAQEVEAGHGQEVKQRGQNSQDSPMDSSGFPPRTRSSSPTETCECVHCFCDLRVQPTQGGEKPQTHPFFPIPQEPAVLQQNCPQRDTVLGLQALKLPKHGDPGGGAGCGGIICSPTQHTHYNPEC